MDQKLQDRCNLQIKNEQIVRKAGILQFEELAKLGALFYTAEGRTADREKIKQSRDILKQKTGIFSNFRGNLEFAIRVRMSLEANPEAYIDRIISIYNKLKEGRILPGEILTMTAMTIYEQSKDQNVDQIITETREAYARIKQAHKFLTDESDMSFVALMVMSGRDVDKTIDEVEKIYLTLKEKYRLHPGAVQAAALVLAMSNKPTEQKVTDFVELYENLRADKHGTSKGKAMSIYAAFADLEIPRDIIIQEIGEVENWLKQQKGYGVLSTSSDVRRVMAATLVLQHHEADSLASVNTGASTVISQVIAEEVIMTIIMIIVVSTTVTITLNN